MCAPVRERAEPVDRRRDARAAAAFMRCCLVVRGSRETGRVLPTRTVDRTGCGGDAVAALTRSTTHQSGRRSDTEPAAGSPQRHADAAESRGDHGVGFVLIPGDLPGRRRQDSEGREAERGLDWLEPRGSEGVLQSWLKCLA